MSLLITCPICGKRNGYEFRFGGEERGTRPRGADMTPETWCDYVHMRANVRGVQREWWCHRDGCGAWFTILRDTATNLQVEGMEEGDE